MQLWLIPLLPFVGFLINGIFGRRLSKSVIIAVAIGSVVLAFGWVLKTIFSIDMGASHVEHYFTWIQSGTFNVGFDFTVDRLTAIMLMIGTNNSGTFTAPEIAEGVGAVVMEMRKDFPSAKILLLGIFPRSTPGDPVRDKLAEVNRIISKLDDQQHVYYMDIGAKFLDEKGYFLPDSFRGDNLHPQAKGYDIWGAAVKDKLAELMK